jgi:methylated-DNA-[protein]-cysteine S-methyltransferase
LNFILKKYSLFFQKVWLACFEIPSGKTSTYKEIAIKIGKPKAARAVALALKRNPFAPLVPCHRVIRSDGTIGGYSAKGGVQEKIRLLRKEKAIIRGLKD